MTDRLKYIQEAVEIFHADIGAVVPVPANEKAVKQKNWQNYYSKNKFPGLIVDEHKNYTVVVDPDIIVVDVDLKKIEDDILKKAYEKALFKYECFKQTLSVKTPSGGYHFYFRLKEKTRLKAQIEVAEFEEFRGHRIIDFPKNAVMPGSLVNEKLYKFMNRNEPILINTIHELPLLIDHNLDKLGQVFYEIYNRFGLSYHNGKVPEGKRNDTAYAIFKEFAHNDIEKEDTLEIFHQRYLNKFDGTLDLKGYENTLNSAYRRKELAVEEKKIPKEVIVKNYLQSEGWRFRENTIKEQKEFIKGAGSDWQQFKQYLVSDISMELSERTLKTSFKDTVYLAIESECCQNVFHAGKNFLSLITRQSEDYLKTFIDAIDAEVDRDLFYWTMRLWFLESLYTMNEEMIDNSKVNRTCIVFQGIQKVGKTSICRMIVPEMLKDYYFLGDLTALRDHSLSIADNCFIILDDIDTMYANEKKGLKTFMTQYSVKGRKAYAREVTNRRAIANFMATTNLKEHLSDFTGNSRFFPVEIKKINWTIINTELIDKIWGQAAHDYDSGKLKEFREKVDSMSKERDIHVRQFESIVGPEEIFEQYFICKLESEEDKEKYEEINVTTSQISETFSWLKSHERGLYTNTIVTKTLEKLKCDSKRTPKHRLKIIYVKKTDKSVMVETLRQWNYFNETGLRRPELTDDKLKRSGGGESNEPSDDDISFP